MSTFDPHAVLHEGGPEGDPGAALVAADWFTEHGDQQRAAAALDRAHGLAPGDAGIAARRWALLDALSVEAHGLRFRYVPAGTFHMGSRHGDPDERPVHAVWVEAFHIAEVPTTWAAYCQLMGWSPPPQGSVDEPDLSRDAGFHLHQRTKIRLQYCETETEGAVDWHAHATHLQYRQGDEVVDAAQLFGTPPRSHPERPAGWDRKPMVAVGPEEAEELGARLSTASTRYGLPTEAQWEKAARGGLIDAPFPWGHEPPTPERCDFDHFGRFALGDPRRFPPNGYGLFGMSGGVWEWTADPYWALAYRAASHEDVHRPAELPERALRGGSWADCAHMVRVSARMSLAGGSWRAGQWSAAGTPSVGFRLVRSQVQDCSSTTAP